MEGQYITPLNMSQGFAPTKVTFGANFPGCSTLDPIKVSYHNIDWFEPGRTNTFRQYQRSGDINSHLAPMCVCLEPGEGAKLGPCQSWYEEEEFQWYYPDYYEIFGISVREIFSKIVDMVQTCLPDYSDGVGEPLSWAVASARRNLEVDEMLWDGPHKWGFRRQWDFDSFGFMGTHRNTGQHLGECDPFVQWGDGEHYNIFPDPYDSSPYGMGWSVHVASGVAGVGANQRRAWYFSFWVGLYNPTFIAVYVEKHPERLQQALGEFELLNVQYNSLNTSGTVPNPWDPGDSILEEWCKGIFPSQIEVVGVV